MLPVLIAMTVGMALGFLLRGRGRLFQTLDPLTAWVIRLLLFLLGCGIGADRELVAQIPVLGLKGLVLALAGILGSIAAARLLMGGRSRWETGREVDSAGMMEGAGSAVPGLWAAVRGSLAAVFSFALGLPVGWFLPAFSELSFDPATPVLYLLMFLVGLGAGADPTAVEMIKKHGLRMMVLPVSVVLGTFAGCALAALLWPSLPLRESLAVGAGFGYYSLSSLVIRELSGGDWAAVALLSNIARELLTLLAAPLLVRAAGPAGPAAAGGATSMDTTLAATVQNAGRAWAVPALFSGVVLTILVPFVVTAVLTF